jgi:uncharacterized C2H2 Zn-finger protein
VTHLLVLRRFLTKENKRRRRRMNNPYKRMFVLSEEEYSRLKLFQQQQKVVTVVDSATNIEEDQITGNEHPLSASSSPPTPATPKPNYSCSICGKTYKHKRDLRRHVKLSHGIAPPLKAYIPVIAKKKESNSSSSRSKSKNLHVFDKVKKWMTIPC